jgi:predicted dehydrogenase|tara:strand:+ start:46 stop:1092 length:1047 start_codon:yes stop_codon:yes gene_type:complete
MGKKIINWALLSTARINERLIPAIRKSKNSRLLAVASRNLAKSKQYAKKHNIEKAYGSYEDLLEDKEIDIVYISLPNHLHCEWSLKIAKTKKHVLCEKPLAPTLNEIDKMITISKKNKVMIQEATMMRFHPQTNYVRKLIQKNKIGKVHYISAIFAITNLNYKDIRYSYSIKKGGGSLYDLGSYCISFVRSILGKEPKKVFANKGISKGLGQVDQIFSGYLEFENNIEMHFHTSMRSFPNENVTIVGEKGTIILDLPYCNLPGETSTVTIITESNYKKIDTTAFGDSMRKNFSTINFDEIAYDYQVDSVNSTILKGTKPTITLEDSRNNIKTIMALLKSSKKNSFISL